MSALLSVFALVGVGCQSTSAAPCPKTQAVVEQIAAQHADVARLTVHMTPPAGGACCAVASTSSARLGKPSDPEDLKAMQTGEQIVMDEPGAVDVTVPILQKDGKWTAAAGVTMKTSAGVSRDKLVGKAAEIARAVETAMAASK